MPPKTLLASFTSSGGYISGPLHRQGTQNSVGVVGSFTFLSNIFVSQK